MGSEAVFLKNTWYVAAWSHEIPAAGMLARTPMARLGEPEDVAAAALFLVSPAARWIAGKILGVEGGVEAPNGG